MDGSLYDTIVIAMNIIAVNLFNAAFNFVVVMSDAQLFLSFAFVSFIEQ